MDIAENLKQVRAQCGGATLIAVSKSHPLESIEKAYQAGQRDFGENYTQELTEKASQAREKGLSEIRWHFIGTLQSNKIRHLIPIIFSIHSVDSLRVAQKISDECVRSGRQNLETFLQINIDGERSKSGISPEDAPSVAAQVARLPGIFLRGLMCIPNPQLNTALAFHALKNLETRCRPSTHGGLSMGMSEDFALAISCGATHVRVGSKIFGPRS